MSARDVRPPADRHAQVEAALDARVLAALAAAWDMATERGLVAGSYWTTDDIAREVPDHLRVRGLALVESGRVAELARAIVAGLNDSVDDITPELVAEHIWSVCDDA